MGVIDNQLNWRRVWPGPGLDVSSWTLARRMELPDWCFTNRELASVYLYNGNPASHVWAICDYALPDPACIWQLVVQWFPEAGGLGKVCLGLADNVPTSRAEMDAALDIFPYYGQPETGPNYINFQISTFVQLELAARKGIVTGGKKLVIELHSTAGVVRTVVSLVVSGLPTAIPAFFTSEFVG